MERPRRVEQARAAGERMSGGSTAAGRRAPAAGGVGSGDGGSGAAAGVWRRLGHGTRTGCGLARERDLCVSLGRGKRRNEQVFT